MKGRVFIIASFGDRQKQIQRLLKNIRSFVDYPIHIITTKDSNLGHVEKSRRIYKMYVNRKWPKGSYREGIRNSNYFKVFKALEYDTSVCLLDDDMLIVNKHFVDGFDIAERFGAAVPLNPRVYVKYNMMGADVQQKDLDELRLMVAPLYAPACNFSPFFVYPRIENAKIFLMTLLDELLSNVCRGTLAIWKASWRSGFCPVYLPEQYCVCGSNAEHIKNYTKFLHGENVRIEPMILHLGHKKVRGVFGIE